MNWEHLLWDHPHTRPYGPLERISRLQRLCRTGAVKTRDYENIFHTTGRLSYLHFLNEPWRVHVAERIAWSHIHLAGKKFNGAECRIVEQGSAEREVGGIIKSNEIISGWSSTLNGARRVRCAGFIQLDK